eukprot:COSAG01_NODE_49130_length_375_cov_0.471014_1_plen_32_part_10
MAVEAPGGGKTVTIAVKHKGLRTSVSALTMRL